MDLWRNYNPQDLVFDWLGINGVGDVWKKNGRTQIWKFIDSLLKLLPFLEAIYFSLLLILACVGLLPRHKGLLFQGNILCILLVFIITLRDSKLGVQLLPFLYVQRCSFIEVFLEVGHPLPRSPHGPWVAWAWAGGLKKVPRALYCLMTQFFGIHLCVFVGNLCKYCVIPATLGALSKQRVLLAEPLLLPFLNFVYFKGNLIWTLLIHLHLNHPRALL